MNARSSEAVHDSVHTLRASSSSPCLLVMQVFGMAVVGLAALTCLSFMDPNNVANQSGLQAAGVLILLLNVAYVICMALLISKTGLPKARTTAHAAFNIIRLGSKMLACFGSSMGHRWAPQRLSARLQRASTGPNLGQGSGNMAPRRGRSMQLSLLDSSLPESNVL